MPDRPRRRTFGPVVLAGLVSGTLVAVAGSRPWAAAEGTSPDPLGMVADAGEVPLATALSLVVLACWGVVLVTRRTVRRGVAVLGLLGALGVAATVVTGLLTTDDRVGEALREQAAAPEATVTTTGWAWAAVVGAAVSLVATALAVRDVPVWPEMGTRYDAPAGDGATGPVAGAGDDDASSLELWKALDEGRDPTA